MLSNKYPSFNGHPSLEAFPPNQDILSQNDMTPTNVHNWIIDPDMRNNLIADMRYAAIQELVLTNQPPITLDDDLPDFALNIIDRDYGKFNIWNFETDNLYNDIIAYFVQLIRMLGVDGILSLEDIVKNPFRSNEYSVNTLQGTGISSGLSNDNTTVETASTQTSKDEALAIGNTNTTGQSNALEDSTGRNVVTGNSSATGNDQTTGYSKGQPIENDVVSLSYPMPEQALGGGGNGQFALVGNLPQLNNAFANYGTSQHTKSGIVEGENTGSSTHATNQNMTSNENSTVTAMSQDASSGQAQSSDRTTADSTQTYENDTSTNNETFQASSSTSASQGAVGTRRSGFTTSAIFAQQWYLINQEMRNMLPIWTWWIDNFQWIRGIF